MTTNKNTKRFIQGITLGCMFGIMIGLVYGISFHSNTIIDYKLDTIFSNLNDVGAKVEKMDIHYHSYEKCLDDIDEDKKEDIFYKYFNDRIKWCNIEIEDEYIAYEPCHIEMSLWGENESIGFQIKPYDSKELINTGITLKLQEIGQIRK